MTMHYDPQRHHRRSIRLKGYDYTQAGAYFVTMVTHGRECLFGEVVEGEMRVNESGAIVAACWDALPRHFRHAELDAFVVMPNHVHGIVVFTRDAYGPAGRGEAFAQTAVALEISAPANASPQRASSPRRTSSPRPNGTKPRSLNALIQNFKSVSTRKINQARDAAGNPVWQRDYFERVIRNERELEQIRAYIENNPAQWANDDENLARFAGG